MADFDDNEINIDKRLDTLGNISEGRFVKEFTIVSSDQQESDFMQEVRNQEKINATLEECNISNRSIRKYGSVDAIMQACTDAGDAQREGRYLEWKEKEKIRLEAASAAAREEFGKVAKDVPPDTETPKLNTKQTTEIVIPPPEQTQ